MPVYEDDTLEGAFRKAVRGARYAQKQSANEQTPEEMQRREECRDIRDRFFEEANEIIFFESQVDLKMQILQDIIDEVEVAKDTGLDTAFAALGLVGQRVAAARAALRRAKPSPRPSRDDIDEIVEAADIANDLGGVISGLIEIARGQPRIRRLNNELSELRNRARQHTEAQRALQLQYYENQCLEFRPL